MRSGIAEDPVKFVNLSVATRHQSRAQLTAHGSSSHRQAATSLLKPLNGCNQWNVEPTDGKAVLRNI